MMYKLVFFVPESHVDSTKSAVFAAGAGKIGNYDQCCWQVLGQGQFRPLPGAQPHVGDIGALTCLPEYRVELVCADEHIHAAVAALLAAHPYEEPAFDISPIVDLEVLR